MALDELLQQAQHMSSVAGVGDDYPYEYRTFSEILQKTQKLCESVIRNGSKDIEATELLFSQGIDLSLIKQKLDNLNLRVTIEPCIAIEDFIENEKENANQSAIEKSERIFKMDNVKAKWAEEKTVLLSSLVGPSQEFIDLRCVSQQIVLDHKSVQRTQLNSTEASYAQAVIEYNQTFVHDGYCLNLAQKFASVAECFYDDKIIEMWSILRHMVSVPSSAMTIDPMKRYQEPKEFIAHAKSFLESHFKLYMSSVVMANVLLEKCYGTPNSYNLIKWFVWVKFHVNNMIGLVDIKNGMPLWPHVYYSLRCGKMEIAIEFLQTFDYESIDFIQVIHNKIKHPFQEINSKLLAQMNFLYSEQINKTTDPFKRASFCLIVGFDLYESYSEVVRTIEDFLWLRLYILYNIQSDHFCLAIEQYTFPGLQSHILEQCGESYFHASQQPHTYFLALMLTGQFEAAIEFLARHEDYLSHAVHMALALNQLCALSTSRDVQSPLLFVDDDDPRPMRRLNFAHLIIMYAKSFESRFTVTEALHYYSFLRKYMYSDGRDVFSTCVCDLTIKTQAIELIFGKLNPEDYDFIEVGLLDQFTDISYSTNVIAAMVAEQLVARGMSENAVYLFDLSGLHDKMLKTINRLLSRCVNEFPQPGTLRHRITQTVKAYKIRLETHQFIVKSHIEATFNVLHDFLDFFNLYYKSDYKEALKCLEHNNLIPTETSDTYNCVDNVKLMSEEAYRVFPSVLISVMDIYCKIYAKNYCDFELSEDIEIQLDPILNQIRDKAKALILLAVTIPNKMSERIIERLLKMGNSMN